MSDFLGDLLKELGVDTDIVNGKTEEEKKKDLENVLDIDKINNKDYKKQLKKLQNKKIKDKLLGNNTEVEDKIIQKLYNQKFYKTQIDMGRVKPTFYIDEKLNNTLNKECTKLKITKSDYLEMLLCEKFGVKFEDLRK